MTSVNVSIIKNKRAILSRISSLMLKSITFYYCLKVINTTLKILTIPIMVATPNILSIREPCVSENPFIVIKLAI